MADLQFVRKNRITAELWDERLTAALVWTLVAGGVALIAPSWGGVFWLVGILGLCLKSGGIRAAGTRG